MATSGGKGTILVVEDDAAIRSGLLDVLVFNGYHPHGAANGCDGLDAARNGRIDLILLDVMLPGMDGFHLCQTLRDEGSEVGIIMLTAKGSQADIIAGFNAGADDYVSKPFSLAELMVRIEAVLRRRRRPAAADTIHRQGITFDADLLEMVSPTGRQPITRREMEIVTYLHRRPNRIVSRQELLSQVWRYKDPTVETRTVDIHIQKLRKKVARLIGERPFIRTIRGEGYRLEPEA
ncbi:MAG: response regulator transcription factor [Desulfosarcinaceae bacterium]|nr:response regulator transcription factor [Desulfosarcinaceae bacterium]